MSAASLLLRFLQEADHDDHEGEADAMAEDTTKPWGDVLLASFLVVLVTFLGAALAAATQCTKRLRQNALLHRIVIPGFASGALLATAAFLIIPESLNLLAQSAAAAALHAAEEEELHEEELEHMNETAEVHEGEEEAHEGEAEGFAWKFGAALLGGFLLPILLSALFPPPIACPECKEEDAQMYSDDHVPYENDGDGDSNKPGDAELQVLKKLDSIDSATELGCEQGECLHQDKTETKCESDCSGDDILKEAKAPADATTAATPHPHPHHATTALEPKPVLNLPLVLSILLGDAFHNFTDGIFIGTAFLLCSREIAYTIMATTIYHELAQELADFILLTHHCGLPVWKALVLNFVSGLSVMLGAVLILAIDLSEEATGIILALAAGVYLYITAVESIPRILAETTTMAMMGQHRARGILCFFFCFILGAIPIGLVLLDHGHCEAEDEEH